jgi:hypothetical protein
VTAIIERTAVDANVYTGCRACAPGRDAYTGWGALDATGAIESLPGILPPRDASEPNDDAGEDAARLYFPAGAQTRLVKASVDFWDDQDDVYGIFLHRGETLYVSLVPAERARMALALWRPETVSVADLARQDLRVRISATPGRRERLSWTADAPGWHFLQARLTAATATPVAYRISLVRARKSPA